LRTMPIFLELNVKIPENDFVVNGKSSQRFINSSRIVNVRPWYDYGFNTWRAGQTTEFHSHDHIQILQILDGRLEVDWGNGWKSIENSAVHVLPPGFRHRFSAAIGSWQFGIEFTAEADDRGLLDAMKRVFPEPLILAFHFTDSWKEALSEDLSAGHTVKPCAFHALEDWTISLVETRDRDSADPAAARLAGLLKTLTHCSVEISDIASSLGWSRTKAELICNRRFGCGIMKLHEKMRMEEASRLLLNSGMSIGEVAEVCGFADIYGFSRSFTRVVGISPSAFRRKGCG